VDAGSGKHRLDAPGCWQIDDVPIRSAGDGSFPERLDPTTGVWKTFYGLAELLYAERISPEECKRLEQGILAKISR
jgi:hypothetical protein